MPDCEYSGYLLLWVATHSRSNSYQLLGYRLCKYHFDVIALEQLQLFQDSCNLIRIAVNWNQFAAFNQLWTSDTVSWLTLAHILIDFATGNVLLPSSSHYLKSRTNVYLSLNLFCGWHSPENSFLKITSGITPQRMFKDYSLEINSTSHRGQWDSHSYLEIWLPLLWGKNIVEGPSIDGFPLLAFQSGETMHTATLVHPSLKPTDVQEWQHPSLSSRLHCIKWQ